MSNNDSEIELRTAVINGDLIKVKSLLLAGANLQARFNTQFRYRCDCDNTVLHYARNIEVVKELIAYGADVNATNRFCETPMLYALKVLRIQSIEFYREHLKHGSVVNALDCRCYNALNLAVSNIHKNLDLIELFLEYGSNIHLDTYCQRTRSTWTVAVLSPLDQAMKNLECAKLFIKYTLLNYFDDDYENQLVLTPYRLLDTYEESLNYFEECVCELRLIKADIIYNNLSLYEIIKAKNVQISEELYINDGGNSIRNEVIRALTNTSYVIYHDIISARVYPSSVEGRACLLIQLSEIKFYTKLAAYNDGQENVVLDHYSKLEVAQYLSNKDLLNLIVAFYRFTNQTSCLKRNSSVLITLPETSTSEGSTVNDAKRLKLE